MKKIFISIPMAGKTDDEIKEHHNQIARRLGAQYDDEIKIIDSFIEEDPPRELTGNAIGIWYLGKSIELLANADIAVFAGTWKNNRGCKIEHMCAKDYGVEIVEV